VTGDEKWIYFDNPKRQKTICDPNIDIDAKAEYPRKESNVLYLVGSEGSSIPQELLKSSQTVSGDLYREQIIRLSRASHKKQPEYETRQHKMILLRSASRHKT